MKNAYKKAAIMAFKYALPPLLASIGTAIAIAYPEGYNAFCGVQ